MVSIKFADCSYSVGDALGCVELELLLGYPGVKDPSLTFQFIENGQDNITAELQIHGFAEIEALRRYCEWALWTLQHDRETARQEATGAQGSIPQSQPTL